MDQQFDKLYDLEQLRYREGQTLRGRDLSDPVATEAQLRWWHNRALHDAFGVLGGMDVELQGGPGGWLAEVADGLAIDIFGRELFQAGTVKLPVPFDPLELSLLVRYRRAQPGAAREGRAGDCAPVAVPPEPMVEHVWMPTQQVSLRDGVELCRTAGYARADLPELPDAIQWPADLAARIEYSPVPATILYRGVMSSEVHDRLCALSREPQYLQAIDGLYEAYPFASVVVRRARPLAAPFVGHGTQTMFWPDQGKASPEGVLSFDVDTSAAGFRTTPNYFAWMVGSLNVDSVWLEHIEAEARSGFQFCLRPLAAPRLAVDGRGMEFPRDLDRLSRKGKKRRFTVFWLGAEKR